ncbi:MAG: hypothetical protein O7161_04840, partial [Wolbachia endosymbiont of Halictus tumulorum]|nr:hypothetical protein [Wolbachia endosymbiont of Halictus tumulorum]
MFKICIGGLFVSAICTIQLSEEPLIRVLLSGRASAFLPVAGKHRLRRATQLFEFVNTVSRAIIMHAPRGPVVFLQNPKNTAATP